MPEGISDEFIAYHRRVELFDNVEKYIDGEAEAPSKLDEQYALSVAIANFVDGKDKLIEKVLVNKIRNLDKEVEVFMCMSMINRRLSQKAKMTRMQVLSTCSSSLQSAMLKVFKENKFLLE